MPEPNQQIPFFLPNDFITREDEDHCAEVVALTTRPDAGAVEAVEVTEGIDGGIGIGGEAGVLKYAAVEDAINQRILDLSHQPIRSRSNR
ncbi:hypothetical protein SLA2020_439490 [Shorea laevis]